MNPSAAQPARHASISLSLVSHTNAGKTTLARTLLGRDVGMVRDAPHVTEFADAHTLLETAAGERLVLWDTPGFGDSVRLAKRLRKLGLPDFDAYLSYVQTEQSRAEFAEMIDALTTNKTSFLREHAHFDYLRDSVLPTLGQNVRIWSAGWRGLCTIYRRITIWRLK